MPGEVFKVAARANQWIRHQRSLRARLGAFTVKSAIFYFKFAAFIKAVPFELCSQNRLQVKLWDNLWKRWLWYFVNAVVYSNSAFQFVSFGWNVHLVGMTDATAFHVIYLVLAVLSILYFSNALQKPHQLVMLINQIDYLMRISRTRNLGGKKWHNLLFCMLALNYFAVVALGIMPPVLLIRQLIDPDGPMYMSTILGNGARERYPGLYLAVLGLEMALSYWKSAILTVYFCMWSASVFQNLIWLDQLLLNQNSTAASGSLTLFQGKAETQGVKIRTYRLVQILNVLHNDLNADFSAEFIGICIVCMSGLLFVSITAYQLLSIYMFMPFPAFAFFGIVLITVFYAYLALLEIKSWEYVQQLKTENKPSCDVRILFERKAARRDIKSLRPIRNKLAHFGYSCIAVSQASIEEVFNEVILVLSL